MNHLVELINVPELITRAVGFLPSLLVAIAILAGAWVAFRMTRPTLRTILLRGGFHETLVRMLVDNVYRALMMILGLIMAADQVGVSVTAALASLGVVGIAVGFAAQDTLANIIAGFLIFWDKPFTVGDWVTVTGQYGRVAEITMRTTRIRTNNNTYVVIPNKSIIDQVLENHSKHGKTRIEVPVGIAYKEDIPAARATILAALKQLPLVEEDPAPDVVVKELGNSSVDMLVRVWIDNAGDGQPAYYAAMEASKLALDAAGIEIPYHHLQLFVENIGEQVWNQAANLPALAGGGRAPELG